MDSCQRPVHCLLGLDWQVRTRPARSPAEQQKPGWPANRKARQGSRQEAAAENTGAALGCTGEHGLHTAQPIARFIRNTFEGQVAGHLHHHLRVQKSDTNPPVFPFAHRHVARQKQPNFGLCLQRARSQEWIEAPRIRYAGISTPSFSFIAFWMSMSLSRPKPSFLKAAVTFSTAKANGPEKLIGCPYIRIL